MVDAATVLKKSAQQVSCNLDNEVAILDLQAACYFGLNEVGAFIWQLLDEPRSVQGICDSVVEEFSVDQATCQADVVRFLSSLQQAGLVEGHA